jgi:hypothetical protein
MWDYDAFCMHLSLLWVLHACLYNGCRSEGKLCGCLSITKTFKGENEI